MRTMLPMAAVAGALLAVWVDAGTRTLFAPRELPLGVAMGAIGGAFLLIILREKRRAGAPST